MAGYAIPDMIKLSKKFEENIKACPHCDSEDIVVLDKSINNIEDVYITVRCNCCEEAWWGVYKMWIVTNAC